MRSPCSLTIRSLTNTVFEAMMRNDSKDVQKRSGVQDVPSNIQSMLNERSDNTILALCK